MSYFAVGIVLVLLTLKADAQDAVRPHYLGRPITRYSFQANPHRYFQERRDGPIQNKVKVDVYYETDCPDSKDFITKQLYPTYEKLGDIIEVTLVPYGKAKEKIAANGGYTFTCHHGPEECYGNTIQSCAKSIYKEIAVHLPFIECMETYRRPSQHGAKCARRQGLDWKKLENCAESDLGNNLMHENAKLTDALSPKLHFVPWIVINDEFTYENLRLALNDFKSLVCKHDQSQHASCP